MEKLRQFINCDSVSRRIRTEINSHQESGYLNVVIDKNDDGEYVLKETVFSRLDRRKVKWVGEFVDQRMVFLFKVHDLSTEMVYKGYFDTTENIYSLLNPEMYGNIGFNAN